MKIAEITQRMSNNVYRQHNINTECVFKPVKNRRRFHKLVTVLKCVDCGEEVIDVFASSQWNRMDWNTYASGMAERKMMFMFGLTSLYTLQ